MLSDSVYDAYARDIVEVLMPDTWRTFREIAQDIEALRRARRAARRRQKPLVFLERILFQFLLSESSSTRVWVVVEDLYLRDFLVARKRKASAADPEPLERGNLEYHLHPAKRILAKHTAERLPDVPRAALVGSFRTPLRPS